MANDKSKTNSLAAEEYAALRREILHHMQSQHQIIGFTLVAAGALFGIGLRQDNTGEILLVYPILAAFLGAGWTHHRRRYIRVAEYIREKLENHHDLGWETWLMGKRTRFHYIKNLETVFALAARPRNTVGECLGV